MKFTSYLLICACIGMSMSACDKDEEPVEETPVEETPTPDPDPVDQDEYFKWEIGGDDYLSNDDARFHTYTYIASFKSLQITGREEDGKTGMRLNIDQIDAGYTGTLTYDSWAGGLTFIYNEPSTPAIDYVCGAGDHDAGDATGTLVITRYDDYIEGTFEFTGINYSERTDKKTITNGSFRIKVD